MEFLRYILTKSYYSKTPWALYKVYNEGLLYVHSEKTRCSEHHPLVFLHDDIWKNCPFSRSKWDG
jgi:hypothetical protein